MGERSMTHPNKVRGNTLERELVNWARRHNLDAERAWGSDGRARGWHQEVDVMVQGMPVQCKRHKALPKWLHMDDAVGAVVFREDRGSMYALIRVDDKLADWLGGPGW